MVSLTTAVKMRFFTEKLLASTILSPLKGDSVASLKNSFIEAVEDYVALCQEVGKTTLEIV